MSHLPATMHAARILGPHRTDVVTLPVPTPGVGEVLIEVARAGICGTDLHILEGKYELARFPMTPGHEFAGTVAAVGPGVQLRRVGERVTADPNLPCGLCPVQFQCEEGGEISPASCRYFTEWLGMRDAAALEF